MKNQKDIKKHFQCMFHGFRIKKPICKLLITSTIIITVTSCKKLVEVNAPTNQLVTTSVFNNDETAITSQLGIYITFENNGFLYSANQTTGLSSDELTNYSNSQGSIDLYQNSLNAQNDGGANGLWGNYNYIYQENAILESIPKSTGMSSRVKQLMTGEAQFMRAYLYFGLVNEFGEVPLITTTDYKVNSTLPRTSKDMVYQQMVNDLTNAQSLLSADYIDASDNTGAPDRVRPTTWAAHALLSRIYLYTGKYDLAEKEASKVISNTAMFSLVSDLNQVFKANSQEAIWQLMPSNTAVNTPEGNGFILITTPFAGSANSNSTALSPQLLSAFEPNDKRSNDWIGSYSDGTAAWNYPNKYKDDQLYTGTLEEYSMVLRLAEQYLIRAEARAQQGNITGSSGALADLNVIRNRAGLTNYSGAIDQASVLKAIAHERQVELFTEGDRWFDLKRTKTVDAVMSFVTPQKGGVWNSYQQLYPLPVNDLSLDSKLVQNPGY